uniref:RING-type domain-containing protein n=1 Tax=Steinernema glaseri TaxID=37863 RepID=A0A1I8ACK2_9BILA
MTAFSTNCFNCGLVAESMLSCCRAAYCSICIGFYLEDCEDDRSCCLNNPQCNSPAREEFVFYSPEALEVFWTKRQAEERDQEEER